MMDDFLQFLREPIAQRSLLACVMIGFANGFVSGLVILKKSALQIGTLSCALLPGIAVAVLLFGLTRWSLLTGAVVAALLVGLGSLFVSRTSRLNQDTALSILHTTAFAAGFIVLVRLGLQQKIDDWLFGSIMSLSDSDLWIAFAISSVSVLILLLFRRPILIYLFDPDIATTLGIPSRLISYGIFTLIILVLVSSLQAVGAFLTLGLLATGLVGVGMGYFSFMAWFRAMGSGMTGMGELIIVTLLAGGVLALIRFNGGIAYIIGKITAHIRSRRGAEFSIAGLVSLANLCTANNTIAIITVGPIAKEISDKFHIPPRRSASILDTFSCLVQGVIPYGAQMLMAAGIAQVSPLLIMEYLYYPLILGVCSILAIALAPGKTGKRRKS